MFKLAILVLNGSPRVGGNTDVVLDYLKNLAPENNDWIHLKLGKLKIFPCTACDMCWNPDPCVLKDDMSKIYDVLPEASLIIFASPIYWWNVTSYMKIAIDRLYPLASSKSPINLSGRKAAVVLVFADDDPTTVDSANIMFDRIFDYLKLKDVGRLILPGLWSKGEAKNPKILEKINDFSKKIFS